MTTRNWTALATCLFLGGLVATADRPAAGVDGQPTVDFRLTPAEQARRAHLEIAERREVAATYTIVALRDGSLPDTGERAHIAIGGDTSATDPVVPDLFTKMRMDSVSWSAPRPDGTCDSKQECQSRVDSMCRDAGHGGVKDLTVAINVNTDGSRTCSGDCQSNTAVAFVTCGSASCRLCDS